MKHISNNAYQTNKHWKEFYETIEDESIDVVITDPPYPFKMGGQNIMKKRKSKNFLGQHYEVMNKKDLNLFIELTYNKIKEGGSFFIMSNESNLDFTIEKLKEVGFEIKNKIIWIKCFNFENHIVMGNYFLNAYEYVIFCSKGSIQRINDRMNVFYEIPPSRGKNSKPETLYAHCLKPFNGVFIDPFAGSDPLSRAKMNGLIPNCSMSISNVFKTTDDNDPAEHGLDLIRMNLNQWFKVDEE
jgi:DNA modification methylase